VIAYILKKNKNTVYQSLKKIQKF